MAHKAIELQGFAFRYDDDGDLYGPAMWEGLLTGWESTTLGFMVSNLNEQSLLIDVGAASGIFTLTAGAMGSDAIAYEINPDWFRLLQRNLGLNEFTGKVSAQQKGVTSSFLASREVPPKNIRAVVHNSVMDDETLISSDLELISLSSILNSASAQNKQIVVKMDIEGAEFAILKDFDDARALATHKTLLFVSFHPGFPYNRLTRNRWSWLLNAAYSRFRGILDCQKAFKNLTKQGKCRLPNGRPIVRAVDFLALTFFGAHDYVFDFREGSPR